MMLQDYVQAVMRTAHFDTSPDDETYYGEVPGLDGLSVTATTLQACRAELEELVENWALSCADEDAPLPDPDQLRREDELR